MVGRLFAPGFFCPSLSASTFSYSSTCSTQKFPCCYTTWLSPETTRQKVKQNGRVIVIFIWRISVCKEYMYFLKVNNPPTTTTLDHSAVSINTITWELAAYDPFISTSLTPAALLYTPQATPTVISSSVSALTLYTGTLCPFPSPTHPPPRHVSKLSLAH